MTVGRESAAPKATEGRAKEMAIGGKETAERAFVEIQNRTKSLCN